MLNWYPRTWHLVSSRHSCLSCCGSSTTYRTVFSWSVCLHTCLVSITNLANNASPSKLHHSCNICRCVYYVPLIKCMPFLPVLINIKFAALEHVTRCILPQGIKILSFTHCIHVALTQDSQSLWLLAITTELDHLDMHSYWLYLIHTALQPLPSHFRSWTDKQRQTMPTRQLIDSCTMRWYPVCHQWLNIRL